MGKREKRGKQKRKGKKRKEAAYKRTRAVVDIAIAVEYSFVDGSITRNSLAHRSRRCHAVGPPKAELSSHSAVSPHSGTSTSHQEPATCIIIIIIIIIKKQHNVFSNCAADVKKKKKIKLARNDSVLKETVLLLHCWPKQELKVCAALAWREVTLSRAATQGGSATNRLLIQSKVRVLPFSFSSVMCFIVSVFTSGGLFSKLRLT